MRFLLAVLALLAVAACQPEPSTQQDAAGADGAPPAGGCDVAMVRLIAFTTKAETDVLEARAFGPTCTEAVVVLSLRDAQNRPLWAFASTYRNLRLHDGEPEPIDEKGMQTLLTDWTGAVDAKTAGELPQWPEGQATLQGEEEAGGYQSTPLDRDTYEDFRKRNKPILCYTPAHESQECVWYSPEGGGMGGIIYVFGV